MCTSGWIIKQFDLAINTIESMISNNGSIYTTPNAVLQALDIEFKNNKNITNINYLIPKNEMNIGHFLYMKPDEYKIICQWDRTKYIIVIRTHFNQISN